MDLRGSRGQVTQMQERTLQRGITFFQRGELAVGQVAGADQWATFNVSETHSLSHLFPVLKLLGGLVAGHG